MVQVILQVSGGRSETLWFESPGTVASLKKALEERSSIPSHLQRLTTLGGRSLATGSDDDLVELGHGQIVNCSFSLLGGKGGFGSMLRSQGGRMASKITTNIGACRDLSGRRLKSIEEAKALTTWQKNQAQLKAEQEEKINRKIQLGLQAEEPAPKKKVDIDPGFEKDTDLLISRVSEAVSKALEQSQQTSAEPKAAEVKEEKAKKPAIKRLAHWDLDEFSSSEEEEEEGEKEAGEGIHTPPKKKLKAE